MLKVFDELEEHPHIYRRTTVSCVMDETTTTDLGIAETTGNIACEVYVMFNFRPELLSLPHLNSYVNTPEQLYAHEVDREDEGPNRLPWWWDLKADQ